ncbi:MAG: FAD-dependent oxidoreductase [Candidatus Thermoplasmatota archaeon]
MKKNKIGIIGAGVAGLSAGALLAKEGFDVEIFEKEKFLGGRAQTLDMGDIDIKEYKNILSSFNTEIVFSDPSIEEIFNNGMINGYNLDLGYHLIGGGIISKIYKILPKEMAKDIEIFQSKLYVKRKNGFSNFVSGFEKLKMMPKILRLLLAGEKTMKKLDKTTLKETIEKYGKGKTKTVLEVNSRLITTVNNLNQISTGEVFRTQKEMKLKGVRYPKNGLMELSKMLADFIEKKGGKIFLGKKVDEIIVEENRVKGLVSDKEKFDYNSVVSSRLVQNLFDIVDKRHFPCDYVNSLERLYGTGSLCGYYSFNEIKKDLIGKTFVFLERDAGIDGVDAAGMIDFMTARPDSNLAPKEEYLVQSYIICKPWETKHKETLDRLRNILDEKLEEIIPEYKKNLNWVVYPAVSHLDGVAKTIDNVKPSIKTPVKDLYIIGDCVKASGIGINCALNSSFSLKKLMLDRFS